MTLYSIQFRRLWLTWLKILTTVMPVYHDAVLFLLLPMSCVHQLPVLVSSYELCSPVTSPCQAWVAIGTFGRFPHSNVFWAALVWKKKIHWSLFYLLLIWIIQCTVVHPFQLFELVWSKCCWLWWAGKSKEPKRPDLKKRRALEEAAKCAKINNLLRGQTDTSCSR